ncbi:unnamed protein product [Spirodela intermedia]|uniref:Non-specific lipid-transfer protein n=2 Tax=Spirodela intermedia TaxID=51605 RepID=A0A7I8JI71_SPIIN|nr:unnamed protein product [Spirodela intermedia]CAA6669253.1 unnamed protein product [Spirodela intermedia]CAA7406200.1 unnamed protein product [Spirodela intermedia]
MASKGIRILLAAVVVCLLVAAPCVNAAITCGRVASLLGPCNPYLRGTVPSPSPACCAGVRTLKSLANTKPDRQAVCNCLKRLAAGVNIARARALPGRCGVSIPYTISPTINCATYVILHPFYCDKIR